MAQNADYRLLQTELNAIREEIRILKRGALPSVGTGETVIQNEAKLYFSGVNGLGQSGYIYQSGSNDFVIGNFDDGKKISINNRDSSGTQRELAITIDDTAVIPKISGQDGLIITTNGNAYIDPTGDVCIPMPTSDPHVVNALWNSSGTVKISAG